MPHIRVEFMGREEIRAAIEQLRDYAVQNAHPARSSSAATARSAVPKSQC